MLPPGADAAARWTAGCQALLPAACLLPLETFDARCRAAVVTANERSRAAGEPFPEVRWHGILSEVLAVPLDAGAAGQISRLHASCSRRCVAMPGAREALEQYRGAGMLLGIASNAQGYTRAEFVEAGFHFDDFEPDLVFLSGEHGFAKPSPRVFALLAGRLAGRGIAPEEILMAGDNVKNDIAPAKAAGWQTRLIGEGGWL